MQDISALYIELLITRDYCTGNSVLQNTSAIMALFFIPYFHEDI